MIKQYYSAPTAKLIAVRNEHGVCQASIDPNNINFNSLDDSDDVDDL